MSDLERALHRLRQDLDWPDDDIASRVEARLPAALPTGRGHRRRRTVLVAAVLAPVLAAGLTVTPMRDRVADAFSLIGITFRQTSSGGLGLPGDLALGEPISLAEAGSRTQASLFVAGVGRPPDGVYLDESVPGGMVSMVWRADDRFPQIGDTGLGLVTSHFLGEDASFVKSLGPELTVERVSLGDRTAWWVAGPAHEFARELAPGLIAAGRGAANVLDGHRVAAGEPFRGPSVFIHHRPVFGEIRLVVGSRRGVAIDAGGSFHDHYVATQPVSVQMHRHARAGRDVADASRLEAVDQELVTISYEPDG